MSTNSLCCVLVTFNRIEKLKKAINSYEKQSKLPDAIVVVNNASTDGTLNYLNEWKQIKSQYKKIVINMEQNCGGSGGFYSGIKEAVTLGYDWIYLADDDAYMDKTAINVFFDFILHHKENFAICSEVYDNSGISFMHRRKISKHFLTIKEVYSISSDYNKNLFYVDLFSFVGVFLNKKVVLDIGLPNKDYFIRYDDTEYSLRLKNKYYCSCVPKIKVFHDCETTNFGFSRKSYYGYRNKLFVLKKHFSKRYWVIFYILLRLSSYFDYFYNKEKYKAKHDALRDFRNGKLGKRN